LDRKAATNLREQSLDAGDCGFDLEDVLRRLDQQKVDSALNQVFRLLVKVRRELLVSLDLPN